MSINRRDFLAALLGASACIAAPSMAFAETGSQLNEGSVLSMSAENSLQSDFFGIRDQADNLGLSGVDFEALSLGDGIPTYEYVGGKFVPGPSMFPVVQEGEVAFWIMETEYGTQITDALAGQVNERLTGNDEFSLIYDDTACYLYKPGLELEQLAQYSSVAQRDHIAGDEDLTPLNAKAFGDGVALPVPQETRAYNAYVSVPFVSQNPPSNLCWAASIASIVNCRSGSSFSAVNVAQMWYGTLQYNRALPDATAPSVLAVYGLSYSHAGYVMSASTINNNLASGFPIYSAWNVNGAGGHAMVVRGINSSNALMVMDPEYGFSTANRSGSTWSMRSGYSLATLTLRGGSLRYL